jgi:LacI family transcriptional regulator
MYLDDYIKEIKDLNYTEGYIYSSKLFALKPQPDGIFCANDDTAVGIIQGAKTIGIKVPEDCAVIGFSNYPVSTIVEPSLTTIDDRAIEMGQAAAKLLLQQIEDKSDFVSSQTIVIETDLIIRESTKRTHTK